MGLLGELEASLQNTGGRGPVRVPRKRNLHKTRLAQDAYFSSFSGSPTKCRAAAPTVAPWMTTENTTTT